MIDDRSRLKRPGWPVERVLDWIDGGCVLFDRRLDYVYANESANALFGLAPDGLVGQNLRSQFPTAIASEFQRAALSAFANRRPARAMLHDESTARWLDAACILHPMALATEIARVQAGLPVILMSGYMDPAGPPPPSAVAAFIQKPFTMPALLAAVRRAIARDRPS